MTRDEWKQRVSNDQDALSSLFAIYFGQDWLDWFGRPWTNALDAFVKDQGRDVFRKTLAELEQLLSDDLNDIDLRWLLGDVMRVAFDWEHPEFGFGSTRAWLEALRDELKRRTPQEV